MLLQILSIITLALLAIAIIKIVHSFIFRKKVSPVKTDFLSSEISKHQHLKNQVLLIFEDGYWEIKEEQHSKEWSMSGGSQSFVDLDTDINDK
ncbi:MAG: hypothetical protein KDD94_09865, partial [Calditrichaeota bacterium]|nr:hypothetical protein [Calditrichota bacterium]